LQTILLQITTTTRDSVPFFKSMILNAEF